MIISQINEIFCITIFLRKQIINKHLIRKSLKKINKAHHSVNYVNLDTNEKSDLYKEKSELNKQTEYQAINAMRVKYTKYIYRQHLSAQAQRKQLLLIQLTEQKLLQRLKIELVRLFPK